MRRIAPFLGLLGALIATGAAAVTPISPKFEEETLRLLESAFAAQGFDERAFSAIAQTALGVLGAGGESRKSRYLSDYPQMPHVTAESEKLADGCMRVSLAAWWPNAPTRRSVLRGIYCMKLDSAYRWHTRGQNVSAEK
ncbi:hypothetical protein [Terrarubrum flagellatum]|uniref:hypothetical protein n=1 Tax=Terrirubrum flagellatum TaxID=2895980 RepID=UPI0031452BAE